MQIHVESAGLLSFLTGSPTVVDHQGTTHSEHSRQGNGKKHLLTPPVPWPLPLPKRNTAVLSRISKNSENQIELVNSSNVVYSDH